jgi:hypothetical protein
MAGEEAMPGNIGRKYIQYSGKIHNPAGSGVPRGRPRPGRGMAVFTTGWRISPTLLLSFAEPAGINAIPGGIILAMIS